MQSKNIIKLIKNANKNVSTRNTLTNSCTTRHFHISEIKEDLTRKVKLPKNGIQETQNNLSKSSLIMLRSVSKPRSLLANNNYSTFSSKRYFTDNRDDDSIGASNMVNDKKSKNAKYQIVGNDSSTSPYYLEDSYPPEYREHEFDIYHYLSNQINRDNKTALKHLQPSCCKPYGSCDNLYDPTCTEIKPNSSRLPLGTEVEYEDLPNQKHLPRRTRRVMNAINNGPAKHSYNSYAGKPYQQRSISQRKEAVQQQQGRTSTQNQTSAQQQQPIEVSTQNQAASQPPGATSSNINQANQQQPIETNNNNIQKNDQEIITITSLIKKGK